MDRLIGYHVSPRMWAALEGKDHGLGRVQAAALAMLAQHSERWEVHLEL
jgi:DNA topoisomerase IA